MSISFITLTNEGYLPYTLNCLRSLRKVGISNLRCYAIGKRAFSTLTRKQYDTVYLQDELNTNFQSYRRGNWADIIFYKFKIIHDNLKENDFVCFTDGDMVFKDAAFLNYCKNNIGKSDLLIQNDEQDDGAHQNLCSGFMFIRSNEITLKYFDPAYVRANSTITEGWGDQAYINQHKDQLSYKLLPLTLFPNGRYFMDNHTIINPYLIHFNWLIGHKKSAQIIKFRECYAIELWLLYVQKNLIPRYKGLIKSGLQYTGLLSLPKAP